MNSIKYEAFHLKLCIYFYCQFFLSWLCVNAILFFAHQISFQLFFAFQLKVLSKDLHKDR